MPTLGPQQFNLQVFDTYNTGSPTEPLGGTHIVGIIQVTINWVLDQTDLTDKGVEYGAPFWQGPGNGPLVVYSEEIGGISQPVAKVAWSMVTNTLKEIEQDTPNHRCRWSITPVVQLVRTYTPDDGSPPDIEVVYTASDTEKGAWKTLP
jgi:hypothetical protein